MKVALIIHDTEMRTSFQQYLSEDRRTFKKIYAFNSIDTFISDAYMLTDVNVILLDMHLQAGISALEGFDIINQTRFLSKAKVLLLTSVDDNNYTIFKWLCSYKCSYIDREMSFYNIKEAITGYKQKTEFLVPVITKHKSENTGYGASGYYTVAPLTSREKQIIQHVLGRENETQIADNLHIRRSLVRKYMRTAYHKIQFNTNITLPVTTEPALTELDYKRVG